MELQGTSFNHLWANRKITKFSYHVSTSHSGQHRKNAMDTGLKSLGSVEPDEDNQFSPPVSLHKA